MKFQTKQLHCSFLQQVYIYQDDHPILKRRRTSLQPTKKKGCTAKIAVKEVVRFPKYIASKNTERVRKTISKCLRSEITLAGLDQERRFYISLPAPEEHINHPVSQLTGLFNPVSKETERRSFSLYHLELPACLSAKGTPDTSQEVSLLVMFQTGPIWHIFHQMKPSGNTCTCASND